MVIAALHCFQKSFALEVLSDVQMSEQTGQSLFSLQYIAPGEQENPNSDIGFYRLGMEAQVDLNLNARSIQLGCGGVKGTGCDIDLSNVSLTGLNPSNGSYAGTDAVLQNPFYEFAIKNPQSASQRELVGIRLGASSVLGLLSIGANPDINNLSDDTGINSISGDLGLTVSNSQLSNGCVMLIFCIPFTGTLAPYSTNLSVNRASTLDLTGLQATTTSVVGFPVGITLNNINILGQPLRAVHQLLLSADAAGTIPTRDFYLSLQSMPLTWQKLSTQNFNNAQAQTGWWLSLPNIQISNLDITQPVEVPAGDVIGGAIFSNPIYISPVDLGQKPAKNCWGTLTFC